MRRNAGSQQSSERLCHHRPAEIVTLALVAMLSQKKCVLLRCFHTLRNEAELEAFTQADHGTDDGGIVLVAGHPAHERLVDLQGIDRKLPQITQAGVTNAEVIDRKLYTQVCERTQHGIDGLTPDSVSIHCMFEEFVIVAAAFFGMVHRAVRRQSIESGLHCALE